MKSWIHIVVASMALGAISSLADWIWAHFGLDGSITAGVLHGLLIFVVLAVALGARAGSVSAMRRLLAALPAAGALLAASFYPIFLGLRKATGNPGMSYLVSLLITWVAMWGLVAWLQRWACGRLETVQRTLVRAALASVLSGASFWTISGIWTNPPPEPSYILGAAAWAWAFLPGFASLLCCRRAGSGQT